MSETENESVSLKKMTEQKAWPDPACYQTEWAVLHESIEGYEKLALLLKMSSLALVTLYVLSPLSTLWFMSLLLMLWLQEGIWRTGQSRLENRIRTIESALAPEGEQIPACQLYSDWQIQRGGTVDLISEYIANVRRPTVAYPYVVIAGLTILAWVF